MNNESFGSAPVRVIVIGAGNRARKYLEYARRFPERLRPVAVAELNGQRRRSLAREFSLPAAACFARYEELFAAGIDADMVLVTTPDAVHYDPAVRAIRAGYHVLLEKPIAQRWDECLEIARLAREHGVLVGVCHVLRYHPYFTKIRQLVASGELGEIVSVNHTVCVGLDRMLHSYVRGVFRRAQEANPILLAKCCHDIDFLLWLTQKRCRRLSSFGALRWFREANAPAGSTERCIDCPVEPTCPFSARDLYYVRRDWVGNFDIPEGGTLDGAILRELRTGPYGRCAFRCDNDVADHQIVALEMEDRSTISLTMDAFTKDDFRKTCIRLTGGEIDGDERRLRVRRFRSGDERIYDFSEVLGQPFHAGADLRLLEDFLLSVRDPSHPLRVGIDDALESHRICYAAEESRLTGRTVELRTPER